MKRFDPKNKYLGWGITAFGVIACSILFFMLLQHGKSIGDAISSLLGILSPIIWGMVIAYLLWPLTKVFQRKLFEPLLKKIRPKKPVRTSRARGLSVALSILVALLIIAALIQLDHILIGSAAGRGRHGMLHTIRIDRISLAAYFVTDIFIGVIASASHNGIERMKLSVRIVIIGICFNLRGVIP